MEVKSNQWKNNVYVVALRQLDPRHQGFMISRKEIKE